MGFAVGMGRRRARRLGQSLWLRQKEIRLDSYRLRAGESIRGNSCALRTDKVRVRIEPDGATMQEDTISGSFSANKESDLSVSARQSALLLSWVGSDSTSAEGSTSFAWFSRYAGSLLLTIAGSIMSALTGYAIRELPGRLRSTSQPASRGNLRPQ